MILYKAIKYCIIDYCINRIFGDIGRNFMKSSEIIPITQVIPGMNVSRIVFDNIQYFNCVIKKLQHRVGRFGNLSGKKYMKIEFKYEYVIGSDGERIDLGDNAHAIRYTPVGSIQAIIYR